MCKIYGDLAWGRGILNIISMLKERGLNQPKFEQSGGYFRIIFDRIIGGVNLLEYIKTNPAKRVVHFEKVLGLPKRTIERQLKKLKEQGKIEFKGSPKTGGYYT